MNKLLIIFICAMFLMPLKANAFSWKDLFGWLLFSNNATTEETNITEKTTEKINDIKKQASGLEKTATNSFLEIAEYISTPNEIKELENKINATNSDLFQIISDYQKTTNAEKARILILLKTLPDEDKKEFAEEIKTLSEIGEKYNTYSKEILIETSVFSAKATSTDEKNAATEFKKSYSDLSEKATKILNFTNTMNFYAKLIGLSI